MLGPMALQQAERSGDMSGFFDFNPKPTGGGVRTRIALNREKRLHELRMKRIKEEEATAKRRRQREAEVHQRMR